MSVGFILLEELVLSSDVKFSSNSIGIHNDKLKMIPIVVLTTSSAEEDIKETYKNHVNAYLTKPVDLDQFINVMKSIEYFWLCNVRLP